MHQPHTDAPPADGAQALDTLWQSMYLSDRQRTRRLAAQVIAIGEREGDPQLVLSARVVRDLAVLRNITREAAVQNFAAIAREAEALALPRMQWLASDAQMAVALYHGTPESALQLGAATAELPMEQRSLNEVIHAEFLRGVASCWAGKVEEGLHCGHRALYAARQLGHPTQLALTLSFLADVQVNRFGNAEDALPLALEAARILDALPVDNLRLNNAVVTIDALQALGRHEQARAMLQTAQAVHAGAPIWLRRSPRLALQYVRAGLLDQADACLDHFTADAPAEPFLAWEWRLASVLLLAERGEHAQALATAREELQRQIVVDRPARQLLTLHDAMRQCCELLGDAEGARAALQRSQELMVPVLRDAAYARYLSMDLAAAPLLPPARRPADRRRLEAIDRRARQDGTPPAPHSVPRFVAHVTHELATPVSGFLWLSQALLRTPLDEQQRTHVQAIRQGAADMLQLVNDVLDLARMERGLFSLNPRPLDPRAWLEESFLPFAKLGGDRGLQMRLDLPPELPAAVLLDGLRLRQVLNNLLGNALKFTAQGGITLAASWHPQTLPGLDRPVAGSLQLAVHDTGRGIAPEVMRRLFVEFEQGDEAVGPQFGGHGLGLALCRQLLQLMGGQITAHSQPGRGSSFRVLVAAPLVAEPLAEPLVEPVTEPVAEPVSQPSAEHAPGAAQPPGMAPTRPAQDSVAGG